MLCPKVRYNRVQNNRGIFIRVFMIFVPGPGTLVQNIREYVIAGSYCIKRTDATDEWSRCRSTDL